MGRNLPENFLALPLFALFPLKFPPFRWAHYWMIGVESYRAHFIILLYGIMVYRFRLAGYPQIFRNNAGNYDEKMYMRCEKEENETTTYSCLFMKFTTYPLSAPDLKFYFSGYKKIEEGFRKLLTPSNPFR